MVIAEMFNLPKKGYQSEKEDNTPFKLNDLRKTRLTLADLNRMRMANDVRKVEHESKLENITKQYKPPAAAPGPI